MPQEPKPKLPQMPDDPQRHVPASERSDSPDPMVPDRERGLEDLNVTAPSTDDPASRGKDRRAGSQEG